VVVAAFTWGDFIAVLALVVALVSAWFTWRAHKLAISAHERAERAEEAEKRADVRVKSGTVEPDITQWALIDGADRYYQLLEVRNFGRALAEDVRVAIIDASGTEVSRLDRKVEYLPADGHWHAAGTSLYGDATGELRLTVAWRDQAGSHQWRSDVVWANYTLRPFNLKD